MRSKKWVLAAVCVLLAALCGCAGRQTSAELPAPAPSSRTARNQEAFSPELRGCKTVYVSEHPEEFDSYVLGSSGAASYLPQALEASFGGHFYNLFHEVPDTQYDLQLARYLLEQGEVKHLVLVLSPEDAAVPNRPSWSGSREAGSKLACMVQELAAPFFLTAERVRFTVRDSRMYPDAEALLMESGTYDRHVEDAVSIGTLESYWSANEDLFPDAPDAELPYIRDCAANVAQLRQLCLEKGTALTVILTPASAQQLQAYADSALDALFTALAEVTDYWNFLISPLSYDPRYFYDTAHLRNDAAAMVLARVADDPDCCFPDSFGIRCEMGSAPQAQVMKAQAESTDWQDRCGITVPILLYHHLEYDQPDNNSVLSPDVFRHHMELLKELGYETVTFEDLYAFAAHGTPLPEHPVIVTFDDGYESNYTYGFPILRELGQRATIFPIGVSIGHKEFYKDTQYAMTPHFGPEEIEEMLADGTITLGSHTYDMHQWPPFESQEVVRETVKPLPGESPEDYTEALTQDAAQQKELFEALGIPAPTVLAFPKGSRTALTNRILKGLGYKATVTIDGTRVNTILWGLPQSLINLGRNYIGPGSTDASIAEYLSTTAP